MECFLQSDFFKFPNFLCNAFELISLQFFSQETSKFGYWVDGLELAIKSKHLTHFLDIS